MGNYRNYFHAGPLTRPACAGHPLPSGEGFRFDDLLSVSEYLRNPQEAEMNARTFSAIVFVATVLISTAVFAQSQPPTRGPAENGAPAWFLQGSFPDPGGNTVVDADGHVTVPARSAAPARPAAATAAPAPALPRTPGCSRSPLCGNRLTPGR